MKQGRASRDVNEGQPKGRPYAINQNFPSQLGSAIDPLSVEKFRQQFENGGAPFGPTDGMASGPGANRVVRPSGGQGRR